MTFMKTLAAASAVALATASVAQAGAYTTPTVEAAPIVIVEEPGSSLGSGVLPILIAVGIGAALLLANQSGSSN